MDILGTVRTHLTQMVTWLKTRFNVTTLKKKLQSVTTGVSAINLTILFVKDTILAWIKQSKDQLPAQSLTLVELLTKLGTTLVALSLGVLGWILHLIVYQIPQRVLNLLKKGQQNALLGIKAHYQSKELRHARLRTRNR